MLEGAWCNSPGANPVVYGRPTRVGSCPAGAAVARCSFAFLKKDFVCVAPLAKIRPPGASLACTSCVHPRHGNGQRVITPLDCRITAIVQIPHSMRHMSWPELTG